jgi:cytosine/adenosine deaminase-related metal-dependent hydrolase
LLELLADRATRLGEPLSIHLAESQEEAAFLRGEGPFVELFKERNFGAPPATVARSSTAVVAAAGALNANTAAVHAVQLDDEDRRLLAQSNATVVSCPRSNDYLGVGQPHLSALLEAGVPLALGTDSLASAPDLDLFAEMQFLHQQHPLISAPTLVEAATAGGARALGLQDRFGQIAPGMSSALIAVELPQGVDPYELLCSNPKRIQSVRSIERDEG